MPTITFHLPTVTMSLEDFFGDHYYTVSEGGYEPTEEDVETFIRVLWGNCGIAARSLEPVRDAIAEGTTISVRA